MVLLVFVVWRVVWELLLYEVKEIDENGGWGGVLVEELDVGGFGGFGVGGFSCCVVFYGDGVLKMGLDGVFMMYDVWCMMYFMMMMKVSIGVLWIIFSLGNGIKLMEVKIWLLKCVCLMDVFCVFLNILS